MLIKYSGKYVKIYFNMKITFRMVYNIFHLGSENVRKLEKKKKFFSHFFGDR